MMRTLLIFNAATGTRSSRKIRQRCEQDVACHVIACRVFVGEDAPDFHAISEFRRRHVAAFETLFVEVLKRASTVPSARAALSRCAIRGLKLSSPQRGLGNQPRASEQRERRPGTATRMNRVP